MTHIPHPQAGPCVAPWGNCVRNPGLLELLLRALLATLFGRPRTLAWHALTSARPDIDDAWADEEEYAFDDAYAAPRRHWHADCEHPILYVIGPPPNRGMRALPRRTPAPRARTARAPPATRPPPARKAAAGPIPRGLSASL